MANNLERNRTVLYELFSAKFGKLVIQEPRGYSQDNESFKRDSDSRGITRKVDIDLEFFGDGANYIKNIYDTLGIEEKVILTKYEKNRYSLAEEWEIRYIQELDLGTYKINSRTGNVTVNSIEGGLYSDIKNRESDEYDLLDNTSADEIDIGELKTEEFLPLGRKLFLESKLTGIDTNYRVNSETVGRFDTVTKETFRTLPLTLLYSSDKEDISTPSYSDSSNNELRPHGNGIILDSSDVNIPNLFFYEAEEDGTLELNLNLDYKITQIFNRRTQPNNFTVSIFRTEKQGARDVLVEKRDLQDFTLESSILNILKRISNKKEIIEVNKGDSIAIVFTSKFTYYGFSMLAKTGYMDVYLNILKCDLVVQDITPYEQNIKISKCVKPLDLFERIVSKITSKRGLVKSSIFEQGGEYEFMVIDNGLWARGFPNTYKDGSDEEQQIQLISSFKGAFESFNYIEPLCWYTEIIGSTEYIRIEKATDTQRNFIGVDLGFVDDISYESSKIDFFSNIELGHKGSLEYEELNGLDEPNGKSEFTTFVKKNDSKYISISNFRVDAIAYELTRRFNFTLYPKEDTKRDSDIWIHDAKKLDSGIITHKRWNDDGMFDVLPIGIYDPESSWNLRLSPANRLFYGHGYSIKRGLYHYPDKSIKFNSSNSNKNLVTQINGYVLSESGSILIKDLPLARVEATLITFTFKMTQEIDKKIKGFTTINGLEIPNYFGLIEFKDNGGSVYGRLVSLESSEQAKITLIKARL